MSDSDVDIPARASELNMNVEAIIDTEILDEVREDLEEDFDDFVEQFFDDAQTWVTEIRQAVDVGDAETVYQRAHTLKSSCGYLGASDLAETARVLEEMGRAGSVTAADGLASKVGDELDRVRNAIAQILG